MKVSADKCTTLHNRKNNLNYYSFIDRFSINAKSHEKDMGIIVGNSLKITALYAATLKNAI